MLRMSDRQPAALVIPTIPDIFLKLATYWSPSARATTCCTIVSSSCCCGVHARPGEVKNSKRCVLLY